MATSKKTPKRGRALKRPAVEIAHKTEMSFALDAEKIAAIKRCLEKGTLTITMTKVDLTTNVRADEPYLYD